MSSISASPVTAARTLAVGRARQAQLAMSAPTIVRRSPAGSRALPATSHNVVAVAELMEFSSTPHFTVMTTSLPKAQKQKAAVRTPSPSRTPVATPATLSSSSSLTRGLIDRKRAERHSLAVRVAMSPELNTPSSLIQKLTGSSHSCLVVGRSDNLELSGNYSINGPAVITKRDGRLVADILPGGELGCWLQDSELCNVEEVLGDDQGRLTCGLNAEHVEVCGDLLLDPSIRYINHHSKRVLSVSHMQDGDSVMLYRGGNLSHPVNVQPHCDNCTCGARGSFV